MGKFTEKVFWLILSLFDEFRTAQAYIMNIQKVLRIKAFYIFIATSRLSQNRLKSIHLQTQLVVSQDKTLGSFYVSQLGQTCHGLDLSLAKLLLLFGIGARIRLAKIDSHNCHMQILLKTIHYSHSNSNFTRLQIMVQKALSAKSLTHAQGATILTGWIKVLPLFLIVIPGMISRVLYPNEVGCVNPETVRT